MNGKFFPSTEPDPLLAVDHEGKLASSIDCDMRCDHPSSDYDMPISDGEIASPGVLSELLPDEETIELPKVRHVSGGWGYTLLKRLFDIFASIIALIVFGIPMAVIAVGIKLETSGPAIYSQRRVGLNGREFDLYKFRSMYQDAERDGARWASADDLRVTPFGSILRRTRLDELPQFWNVIKGDMSIIGPRPERPVFHRAFCKRILGWEQRLLVKPGITGLAQIEGGYDLLPKEKAELDIAYIERRSIGLDLRIALNTVRVMISGEGSR